VINNGVRPILRAVLVLNIVATVVISAFPQEILAQEQQNLLKNGGFEQGWYDVSGTQQCPNHWRMHWTEGEQMGDANNVTVRPESRVLPKAQVPPDEHSLFFWDGNYTVKIFWSKAPIHAGMSQDVSGLEVGREYRFVVPVNVDTYDWESGKVAPADPFAAQVRLGAGPKGANWQDGSAINFSNWANPTNTSPYYLARTTLQFTFVATAPEMTVYVEYAAKWGMDNNGIFMDALRLEPLGMAHTPTPTPLPPPPTATPGPSPTPLPTPTPRPDGSIVHVVQSGDTLSSIAVSPASVTLADGETQQFACDETWDDTCTQACTSPSWSDERPRSKRIPSASLNPASAAIAFRSAKEACTSFARSPKGARRSAAILRASGSRSRPRSSPSGAEAVRIS